MSLVGFGEKKRKEKKKEKVDLTDVFNSGFFYVIYMKYYTS